MTPCHKRLVCAFAAIATLVACADRELADSILTAPTSRAVGAAAESRSDDTVRILKRTESLDADLTTTGVIGPDGGSLEISQAGLRVDFTPGALDREIRISVTARRGTSVVYEFQPHGLRFSAPVIVSQSLKRTAAETDDQLASQLQGSYFDRFLVDASETFTRVNERRPARLNKARKFLEFSIEHFSGYVLSTGKIPVEAEIQIDIELH